MSAEVRAALAAAAETVEGISCSPYFRQSTKTGDSWVRLDQINRSDNGFGFINRWQVIVVLPADLASAEKYLDTKVAALVAAVGEELVVTSVTPQQLALDTATVPCIVIEGSRESDI